MEQKHGNFLRLPLGVYNHKLNGSEFTILVYLMSFQNRKDIYPSIKNIAETTGFSDKTVNTCIKSLKDKGLISYKKGNTGYSNRYKLNFDKIDPKFVKKKFNPSKKDVANSEDFDKILDEAFNKSF